MFKTIAGNAPEYLRTSFTFATDIHAILYVHHLASNCILQSFI